MKDLRTTVDCSLSIAWYRNMAASSAETLKKRASEAIDSLSSELWELNNKIWKNPELGFKEKFAHELLTTFLDKQGFTVTRHFPLDTAFVAKVNGDSQLPTVGVICEYDALPEIGHACGHNLIAEAGIAAAIGIKAAIEFTNEKLGNLVVLGTPAEEGGGGKLKMIDSGCFKDLDICMMVHPFPVDDVYPVFLARVKVTVRYNGQAAHAAAFPWEGVNALDAAVMAYNNISVLRQQMKPTWRVHGVITHGGVKPNIIPEKSEMVYSVRAPTNSELEVLKSKVQNCFEAASKATGCTVDVTWAPNSYDGLLTNSKLAELYKTNAQNMGIVFKPTQEQKTPKGSTDMGNVSNVVPSIHPLYSIGSTAVNHTRAFTAAAGTEEGHKQTLTAAKAMAMSAIDVLYSPKVLAEIKEEFNKATK